MTVRHLLAPLLFVTLLSACSSSRTTEERPAEREGEVKEEKRRKLPPAPPAPWGEAVMELRAIDTDSDTVTFHIGSPLILRLSGRREPGCAPFDGRPFYFDAVGAQIGWGFVEVADSILLPHLDGECDRYLLLTSENSNRLPEGVFTVKTEIFIDEKRALYSDTITLRCIRSPQGADTTSFNRFLIEQILRNSPLLADPETLGAVFGEGTPRGAESEVYRGLILLRGGDAAGAWRALEEADRLVDLRGRPLDSNAERVRRLLRARADRSR